MRTPVAAVAVMLSLLPATLSGCPQRPEEPSSGQRAARAHLQETAQAGGLAVALALPKRVFTIGETATVTITARNLTDKPIRIVAPTRTYCVVGVLRHTGLTWEQVKEYPPSAMRIQTPWVLPAGGRRTFRQSIPVEPDWPTALALRMTARLNGTAGPVCTMTVRAQPQLPGE